MSLDWLDKVPSAIENDDPHLPRMMSQLMDVIKDFTAQNMKQLGAALMQLHQNHGVTLLAMVMKRLMAQKDVSLKQLILLGCFDFFKLALDQKNKAFHAPTCSMVIQSLKELISKCSENKLFLLDKTKFLYRY